MEEFEDEVRKRREGGRDDIGFYFFYFFGLIFDV